MRGLPHGFVDVSNHNNTPDRVIDTGEGKAFRQQHFSTGEHWHRLLDPGSTKAYRQKFAKPAAQVLVYVVRPLCCLEKLYPSWNCESGITSLSRGLGPLVRQLCYEALSDSNCRHLYLKMRGCAIERGWD